MAYDSLDCKHVDQVGLCAKVPELVAVCPVRLVQQAKGLAICGLKKKEMRPESMLLDVRGRTMAPGVLHNPNNRQCKSMSMVLFPSPWAVHSRYRGLADTRHVVAFHVQHEASGTHGGVLGVRKLDSRLMRTSDQR